MSRNEQNCPVCDGGPLEPATYTGHFEHRGSTLDVDGLRYHECLACGADPVLKDDYTFNHRCITNAKRAADGLLSGPEIRQLRSKLGLSQRQSARIFGGGVKAFSKYESGDVMQSVAMDRLLRLVAKHPELLGELDETEAA